MNFNIWYNAEYNKPLMNPAQLFSSYLCKVNECDTLAVYCFYRKGWYVCNDNTPIDVFSFCMISIR